MRKKSPSPRRFLAYAGTLVAATTALAALYSCSLIVETRSQQCQSDSDCAGFAGYPTCNTVSGLCVGSSTSSTTSGGTSSGTATSSGGGCYVDGGATGVCYDTSQAACAVSGSADTINAELLNACTSGCVPFDNATKVPALLAGGQLPMLPSVGPDGGF
jgi:hypothetical protein